MNAKDMSLRDYFAAHAPDFALDIGDMAVGDAAKMLGIEKYQSEKHYAMLLSLLAYQYADAMLARRDAAHGESKERK